MRPLWRRLAWCALWLGPLLLLAPAFAPGKVFLPMHTFQDAPLTLWETDPLVRRTYDGPDQRWNGDVVDKLYPITTDALAMREDGLLWSNRWCGGAPMLAQGLSGFLYPPNLLFQILDPLEAFAWLAALSLFLGAFFAWAFLRALGLHPLAAVLGGLSYGLSLYTCANLHYYMRVDAAVWIPALFLCVRRNASDGGIRWKLALSASVACSFLAGFPQITFYGLYAAGLYGLFLSRGVARREGRRAAGVHLGGLILFLGLGGALAATQLLPQREGSEQSLRSASNSLDPRVAWQTAPAWADTGMEPAVAWTAILPYLLGSPADVLTLDDPLPWVLLDRPYRPRDVNQAQGYNFTENQLYVGLLPFLAALLALVLAPRRSVGPWLGFAFCFAFACAFLPAGVWGWPLRAVYSLPFAQVGGPPRILAVAVFFLAWAAAIGFDALVRGGARTRAVAGVALALLTGGATYARMRLDETSLRTVVQAELEERAAAATPGAPVFDLGRTSYAQDGVLGGRELERVHRRLISDLDRAAVLGLIGALVLLLATLGAHPALAGLVLVLAVGGDLVLAGRIPNEPQPSRDLFARPPPVQTLIDVVHADGPAPHRIVRSQQSLGEAFSLLRPNLPGAYGIPDLSGYIVVASARLALLFEALDPQTRYDRWVAYLPLRLTQPGGPPQWLTHGLLDAAGIGWILSLHPLHQHPDPAVREALELIYEDDPPVALPPDAPRFRIFARKHALPRAFLARSVRKGERAELVQVLQDPSWKPAEELLLATEDALPGVDLERRGTGAADLAVESYEPTRVALRKQGDGSGGPTSRTSTGPAGAPTWTGSSDRSSPPTTRSARCGWTPTTTDWSSSTTHPPSAPASRSPWRRWRSCSRPRGSSGACADAARP